MTPLQVFIGYDPRQPLAYTILQHSIVSHSSMPVSITPLILGQLPIKRRGLTEFTYSRFIVPWLCGFKGSAVFMDADIIVKGDIKELFEQADPVQYGVQVMKNQPRFEWPSVMLFNNACCLKLTPEFIDDAENKLFDLLWAKTVGSFSDDWNHCVGYTQPKQANLYHYTQGLPCWFETQGLEEDDAWHEERDCATKTVSWSDLMLGSVHAERVLKRMLSRYGVHITEQK